jgi:hypothetical protein
MCVCVSARFPLCLLRRSTLLTQVFYDGSIQVKIASVYQQWKYSFAVWFAKQHQHHHVQLGQFVSGVSVSGSYGSVCGPVGLFGQRRVESLASHQVVFSNWSSARRWYCLGCPARHECGPVVIRCARQCVAAEKFPAAGNDQPVASRYFQRVRALSLVHVHTAAFVMLSFACFLVGVPHLRRLRRFNDVSVDQQRHVWVDDYG